MVKLPFFNVQRAITPKECNPELRFLRSAHCLILHNISVKFHENISNGFYVTERIRFCDRQTTDANDKNNYHVDWLIFSNIITIVILHAVNHSYNLSFFLHQHKNVQFISTHTVLKKGVTTVSI